MAELDTNEQPHAVDAAPQDLKGLDKDFYDRLGTDAEVTIPAAKSEDHHYTAEQLKLITDKLATNQNITKIIVDGAVSSNPEDRAQIIRSAGNGHKLNSVEIHGPMTDADAHAMADVKKETALSGWNVSKIDVSQAYILAQEAPDLLKKATITFGNHPPTADDVPKLETIANVMHSGTGHLDLTGIDIGEEGKKKLAVYKHQDGTPVVTGIGADAPVAAPPSAPPPAATPSPSPPLPTAVLPADKLISDAATQESIVISDEALGENTLSPDQLKRLTDNLKANKNLKSLEIQNATIDNDAQMAQIVHAAGENKKLDTLKVTNIDKADDTRPKPQDMAKAVGDVAKTNPLNNTEFNALWNSQYGTILDNGGDRLFQAVDTDFGTVGSKDFSTVEKMAQAKKGHEGHLIIHGKNFTDEERTKLGQYKDKDGKPSVQDLDAAAPQPAPDQHSGPEETPPSPPPPSPNQTADGKPGVAITPSPDRRADERAATAPAKPPAKPTAAGKPKDHGAGHKKLVPDKAHHKNYQQSAASPDDTLASDKPDELADRAAKSVENYKGPDGNPLPSPINVYGKVIPGAGDKIAASIKPAAPGA